MNVLSHHALGIALSGAPLLLACARPPVATSAGSTSPTLAVSAAAKLAVAKPAAAKPAAERKAPASLPPIEPRVAQNFEQPRVSSTDSATSEYRAFVYAERPTGPLELFVFPASAASAAPRAAVLLFHSGGWTRGRPEWLFGLAKQFASLGLVSVPVRYRLAKDGLTPIDAMADACSAFRWIRAQATDLGVDPKRIAGWGASAGGQLVASSATVGCAEPQPKDGSAPSDGANALLLVSAGVDVEHSQTFRKLAGDGIDLARYSPLAHVRQGVPPTLLVTGAEDSVTPLTASERYCNAVRAAGSACELVVFPKLGHLLTRRLEDQRTSLDPDPSAEHAAYVAQERFLRTIGFIPPSAPGEGK